MRGGVLLLSEVDILNVCSQIGCLFIYIRLRRGGGESRRRGEKRGGGRGNNLNRAASSIPALGSAMFGILKPFPEHFSQASASIHQNYAVLYFHKHYEAYTMQRLADITSSPGSNRWLWQQQIALAATDSTGSNR